jgi:flagellar hook-length control protein FliK
VAINSTPPPSITPALAPKAGPAGSSTGKLPNHGPGTPVYPPQSLPGRAPLASGQAAPATPAAPALPASAAAAAATAAAAAPANAASALAQAAAPDAEATPAAQPNPRAPAPPGASRARPKNSAPARPEAPATAAAPGAPLAAGETSAAEAAPMATDEPASSLETPRESPVDSGRPGQTLAVARDGGTQDPASAVSAGPVLPLTPAAPGFPAPASQDAPAGSPAVTPAAAALPVAAAAAGPVAASGASASDTSSAVRSSADAGAADTPQTSADPAALLSDPANVRSTGAAANATPPLTVHAEVGTSGWTEEVGTHVVWMAHQGMTDASLRLQPEHLGPLEVKISLHDNDASVWFGASAPATRAALEQALPQLKEMFAAQGMTLTDAGVSRESARDAQYAPRPSASASAAEAENATAVAVAAPRRGLIDTYA